MSTKRKMAFTEIDKGKLELKTQRAFEDIQMAVEDMGGKGSVVLEITVFPQKGDGYGETEYSIKKRLPAEKSHRLTTELTPDGIITADGDSRISLLQEELDFKEETTIHKIK